MHAGFCYSRRRGVTNYCIGYSGTPQLVTRTVLKSVLGKTDADDDISKCYMNLYETPGVRISNLCDGWINVKSMGGREERNKDICFVTLIKWDGGIAERVGMAKAYERALLLSLVLGLCWKDIVLDEGGVII